MINISQLQKTIQSGRMTSSTDLSDGSVVVVERADGTQMELADMKIGLTKSGERALILVEK